MGIEKHIRDLLLRYDCVIVPGFGGFIANPESAKVDPRTHQFTPPARSISFNSNLKRNDGLLADRVAEINETSYEVAIETINTFVSGINRDLNEGRSVTLSKIGIFCYDKEENVQFEPDISANNLIESFGFTSFKSPAIQRDSIERKIEKKIIAASPKLKKFPSEKPQTPGSSVKIKRYWPAAAAVFLLCVMIWGSLQTNMLKNVSLNSSDLNPFSETVAPVYHPRVHDKEVIPHVNSKSENEIDAWLKSVPKEPIAKVIKPKIVKRFHVIGGCFKIKANANKLMNRLKRKGFDPQVVGKNRRGLYRVAYGSYETRATAKRALRSVKKNHIKSAWLFVR
ncbi:MAG TPA: SPOR domain-containing protein [Flavobacteriales bacterium]|nr:SPOR domain-containing protein [Flavobacteriales bacterium]